MEPSPHILVVDDHREIRELLGRYLTQHGFRVTPAESAAAARHILKSAAVDLIVLDVLLPGESGLQLTRSMREAGDVPIILLTAMGDETDRIVGLEMGADDYLTKPFSPRELVARIRTVLRRTQALPRMREPTPSEGSLRFDRWQLDLARRELLDETGVAVPLSSGEFRLLAVLLERPGLVLTRDQLLDLTRGRTAGLFDRSIDNQVSRLRRRIERDPARPALIKTVRGDGYSFVGLVTRCG
ncbi:MAG: response regulator [Gemmatimonadaceae bacterium]|nr:response regulator [Acetobacteraceae bacterium]